MAVSELAFELLESTRDAEVVPLGSAFPAPHLFPFESLARCGARAMRRVKPVQITNGLTAGDEALRRYRLARARKAELETRKVERDLIPAREVAELLQRWCVGFRERLLAIPGRLSDRLPAEHQDALRKELIGTLQGLYELRDEWAKVSA